MNPKRLFCLSAELRRAAMWAIGGALLIAVVVWLNQPIDVQRAPSQRAVASAVFVLIALWMGQYLLPRVRVDEQGISRRLLWWWDLWPWQLFTDGQVRYGLGRTSFECPGRRWWTRSLNLEYLDKEDAISITQLIRRVWTPPMPASVRDADDVSFTLKWPDRKTVNLTVSGLEIVEKKQCHSFRWSDVSEVTLWRLESERPDFQELNLQVSDLTLKLFRRSHQGSEVTNWTGATPESIVAVLTTRVAEDRVHDFALNGPCRSLEEVDARLQREVDDRRHVIQVQRFLLGFAAFMAAALLIIFRWQQAVIMGSLYAPLLYAVHWMFRDQLEGIQKRCRDLEGERTVLADRDSEMQTPALPRSTPDSRTPAA